MAINTDTCQTSIRYFSIFNKKTILILVNTSSILSWDHQTLSSNHPLHAAPIIPHSTKVQPIGHTRQIIKSMAKQSGSSIAFKAIFISA